MKTTTKEITPQWASQILETRNPQNRNLRARKVDQYAADMKAGRWFLTHQGIALDEHGDLLDGQHRLAAVVKAGIPVKMQITTGIPKTFGVNGHTLSVFSLVDGGSPRRASDALQISGHKNSTLLAAIAGCAVKMTSGEWGRIASTPIVEQAVHLFGGSLDAVASAARGTRIVSVRASGLAAFAYLHTTKPELAIELLSETQSVSGKKLSPSRALATWFSRHPSSGGASQSTDAYICASALFHQSKGNEIEKLYGGEDAVRWLVSTNPALSKSLKSLV